MRTHTRSFTAVGQNGRSYALHEYVEKIDVGDLQNANQTINGTKVILTNDGDPVNYVEKGKYRTLSGEILVSSDVHAP